MNKNNNITISDFQLRDSSDIELTLLNTILVDSTVLYEVTPSLRPEHFSDKGRGDVFRTIREMEEKHESISMLTVSRLVDNEVFSKIITADTVMDHEVQVISLLIIEDYMRRQAYETAVHILQTATSHGSVDGITKALDDYRETFAKTIAVGHTQTVGEILNDLSDELENDMPSCVSTGFNNLDQLMIGGFEPGELVVIAARPSVGKTAVALHMAHVEAIRGEKVEVISLEMTAKELAKRYMYAMEKIDAKAVRDRSFNWEDFESTLDHYSNLNIFINDSVRSLDEICQEARARKQSTGLDILYIDYIGIISDVVDEPRFKANIIAKVTGRLKRLAKELGITIVALSQLNRDSARERRAPQLSDLRDSGSIEQDADHILMLNRPEDVNGGPAANEQNCLTMWVRKQRRGPAGEIALILKYNQSHTVYNDVALVKAETTYESAESLMNDGFTPAAQKEERPEIESQEF